MSKAHGCAKCQGNTMNAFSNISIISCAPPAMPMQNVNESQQLCVISLRVGIKNGAAAIPCPARYIFRRAFIEINKEYSSHIVCISTIFVA